MGTRVSIIVFGIALLIYLPPALVNEAPFWDDKAYINNALIASGRISASQALGPYAEERPPLFWWFLTLLYFFGAPVESARIVSPLITSVSVVAIFLLTSKMFKNSLTGLLTSLFIIFLDYFVLTTSYILTDAVGSVIAFLTLLSFSLGLRYGPYMWASGALLASAILARDQNLLLIPTLALALLWSSKTSKTLKLVFLALLGLASYTAVTMRQEVFLQTVSDITTPIFLDKIYLPFLTIAFLFAALAVYKVAEQRNLLSRRPSVEERWLDILLGIIICLFILYPFFIDNIRLGDEYQIAGKGILSRPVAHSIMVGDVIVQSGLNTFQRATLWSLSTLRLITFPLIILSVFGGFLVIKNNIAQARPLLLWAVVSILYVFFFTHIEYRFLAQAVPPLTCLAAYSISRLSNRNRTLGVAVAVSTLIYASFPSQDYGIFPTFTPPTTVVGWSIIIGLATPSGTWLSNYVVYLDTVMKTPALTISPLNILSAWAFIPSLVFVVYLAFRRGLLY